MTAYRGGEDVYGILNDPHGRELELGAFTPSNFTPVPADAVQLALLTAYLRGIDATLAGLSSIPAWGNYKFFSQASDGSGNTLKDQGMDRNDATITTATNAWGTAGQFTTTESAASDQAARLRDIPPWDFRNDSLIWALQITATAPAAATYMLGNYVGAASIGMGLRMLATGKVTLAAGDGTNTVTSNSNGTVADGTQKEVVIALDGEEKTAFLYIDGVVDTVINGVSFAAITGTTVGTAKWCIGSAAAANNAIAANYDNIHLLHLRNRGLPADMASLVAAYSASPSVRFTAAQIL